MLRKAITKEKSDSKMLKSAFLWKRSRMLNHLFSSKMKNLSSTVFLSRLKAHKLAKKRQAKEILKNWKNGKLGKSIKIRVELTPR